MNRIVNHVNQGVTEFWVRSKRHGFVSVPRNQADKWKPGTFEYVELRHNNEKRHGVYGPHSFG